MVILKRIESDSWFRKKIVLLVALMVIVLTVIEIWAVNRLATYGEKISKLEKAKASLSLENQVLENEIAKQASLLEIEKTAKLFGFEKIKNFQYILPSDLALNH